MKFLGRSSPSSVTNRNLVALFSGILAENLCSLDQDDYDWYFWYEHREFKVKTSPKGIRTVYEY